MTYEGRDYLITVDYGSTNYEMDKLEETTSEIIISKSKANFARYGIPDSVVSDNASYFTSEKFQSFSKKWKFKHETISPGNSQANRASEAAVKKAKKNF